MTEKLEWAVAWEAAAPSSDLLPALPLPPVAPAEDAPEHEQQRYAEDLASFAEAQREYQGKLAEVLADESHWTEAVSTFASREDAQTALPEIVKAYEGNPFARNFRLVKSPPRKWADA